VLDKAAAALPFRTSRVLTRTSGIFALAKAYVARVGAQYSTSGHALRRRAGLVKHFKGRIGLEELAITVYFHSQPEQRLRDFTAAYDTH
jgi:hypothetical protein